MNISARWFLPLQVCITLLLSTFVPLGAQAQSATTELKSACNDGNMRSCVRLGAVYFKGKIVPKDLEKALLYNEKACSGGHAIACKNVSGLYLRGLGVPKDPDRAQQFKQKSCDLGNASSCPESAPPQAISNAGNDSEIPPKLQLIGEEQTCNSGPSCFQLGKDTQPEAAFGNTDEQSITANKKALLFYQKACDEFEHGDSCNLAGHIYTLVLKDEKLAANLYEAGCVLGSKQSCTSLGHAYRYGKGVSKNYVRAAQILTPQCTNTPIDHYACSLVGEIHDQYILEGDGKIEKNWKKAVAYYALSCDTFRKTSVSIVSVNCGKAARLYMKGGPQLPVNKKLGVKFFLQGCDLNLDNSKTCLEAGLNSMSGKWTKKNTKKGILMIEQACKKEVLFACYHVGKLYESGRHKQKDMSRAANLYTKSCDIEYAKFGGGFSLSCIAAADIFASQNRFSKADELYTAICDNKGIECNLIEKSRLSHQCNIQSKDNCEKLKAAAALKKKTKQPPAVKPTPKPIQKPSFTPAPTPSYPVYSFDPPSIGADCSSKSTNACFKLAKDYFTGDGTVSKNTRKARDMFVTVCNKGHANACMFAGQTYSSSDYNLKGAYSMSKTRTYYIKACDLGKADGCTSAASTYPGSDVYDEDKLPLYERACKMGNRGGCTGVDRINNTGDYAPR